MITGPVLTRKGFDTLELWALTQAAYDLHRSFTLLSSLDMLIKAHQKVFLALLVQCSDRSPAPNSVEQPPSVKLQRGTVPRPVNKPRFLTRNWNNKDHQSSLHRHHCTAHGLTARVQGAKRCSLGDSCTVVQPRRCAPHCPWPRPVEASFTRPFPSYVLCHRPALMSARNPPQDPSLRAPPRGWVSNRISRFYF